MLQPRPAPASRLLLLVLLLLLGPHPAEARASKRAKKGAAVDNSGPDHPETLALSFPGSFSPEECARIYSSGDGQPLEEARVGNADSGKSTRANGAGERVGSIRSTKLRFIARGQSTSWIYDRLLAIARQANAQQGWKFGTLSYVQDIQLGVYDGAANPPGHYDWHADEEGSPGGGSQVHRLLSISVQLTDPAEYTDGNFQVGLLNMSRAHGSTIVFPSVQSHTILPVTRGVRASLVAWVVGDPAPSYWQHAATSHELVLHKAYEIETPADKTHPTLMIERPGFPDGLRLVALSSLLPGLLQSGDMQMSHAVSKCEVEIRSRRVAEQGATHADGQTPTMEADSLAKVLVFHSLAITKLASLDNAGAERACARATVLLPTHAAAWVCRARWSQHVGLAGGSCPALEADEADAAAAAGPLGCHEATLRSYRRAFALSPEFEKDWSMWFDIATAAIALERPGEAFYPLEKALETVKLKPNPALQAQATTTIEALQEEIGAPRGVFGQLFGFLGGGRGEL
jgi:hypothetical protein